jgi:hypothetical protein
VDRRREETVTWLLNWFRCQHMHVLFDRVNGVACWRCAECLRVQERAR